jgi:hypothetical protein
MEQQVSPPFCWKATGTNPRNGSNGKAKGLTGFAAPKATTAALSRKDHFG